MLAGAALEYYYTSCRGQNLDITTLYERLRNRFEGEEHRRNMLREWNNTTLRQMIQEQLDKSKETVFRTMVQRLQNLQRGLDIELQSESNLRNKIIAACEDVPACSIAIARPATTITGLTNEIFSAISAFEKAAKAEKLNPLPSSSSSFLTNRRYHTSSHRPNYRDRTRSPRSRSNTKRCFVCRKEGC